MTTVSPYIKKLFRSVYSKIPQSLWNKITFINLEKIDLCNPKRLNFLFTVLKYCLRNLLINTRKSPPWNYRSLISSHEKRHRPYFRHRLIKDPEMQRTSKNVLLRSGDRSVIYNQVKSTVYGNKTSTRSMFNFVEWFALLWFVFGTVIDKTTLGVSWTLN